MTSTGWRWLVPLGVVAVAVGFGVAQVGSDTPTSGAASQDATTTEDAAVAIPFPRVVVGFGHVDVEGGVVPLALGTVGTVAVTHVEEGDRVQAGEPLIRLETAQTEAMRAKAEASLREAQTRLLEARRAPQQHSLALQQQQQAVSAAGLRVNAQERQVAKLKNLRAGNAVAAEDYQSAVDRLEELRAALFGEELKLQELQLIEPSDTIALAEAAVDAAQAQLDLAVDELARRTLTAPSDGEVLRLMVQRGQTAGPDPRAPAIWFCPAGPRIVRCEVDQEFASRVEVGRPAEMYTDGDTDQMAWTGRVHRKAGWIANRRSRLDEPFERNDVRTLECIIELDPDQPELLIGQRMRVLIQAAQPGTEG